MKTDKERMENVERWANFVVNNEDKVWSELQAELIDSQIENAEQIGLTKEQVKYIKEK
ncbi:hypothetical protein J4418_05215 [Candidatus Woesearchaeota archaeon]|nr:hypothetical protein [Candidatus Woesearchaeota archaeon]